MIYLGIFCYAAGLMTPVVLLALFVGIQWFNSDKWPK